MERPLRVYADPVHGAEDFINAFKILSLLYSRLLHGEFQHIHCNRGYSSRTIDLFVIQDAGLRR